MSEKFVAPQAFVSKLLHALIVEELKLRIGGAAKRACLGDTHVHGSFTALLGLPVLAANFFFMMDVGTWEEY